MIPDSPIILSIDLPDLPFKELSSEKFLYLQRAKTSTIQKHHNEWAADGYVGIKVVRRDGNVWHSIFDVKDITFHTIEDEIFIL